MPIPTKAIVCGHLDDGATYDLYAPPTYSDRQRQRLLVSVLPRVESVPRERALELFADLAAETGRIILAPRFDITSGFQFLGIGGRIRYDLCLLRMVEDVAGRFHVDADQFDLFGYSAGGQFGHRFLYVHPERLHAMAFGAPGSVTLPSTNDPWPSGIAGLSARTGRSWDLETVRRVRLLLFVGEQDVTDEHLPITAEANRFGRTRVERADTLHAAWLAASIDHTYVQVPAMGHADLDLAMGEVRRFLNRA